MSVRRRGLFLVCFFIFAHSFILQIIFSTNRLRLSQVANDFVGNPEWAIPTWDMVDRHGAPLLFEYEREGVRLPWFSPVPTIKIVANCEGEGRYCSGDLATYNPEVCIDGYTQVGYDRCCRDGDTQDCVYPSTAE